MFCRPLPGFPKRCQGSPIEQDSCSAPDGDDSSPAMLRRVGVGLSVNRRRLRESPPPPGLETPVHVG
eukprot:6170105-Pyramimonas_sp.AAC.1